MHGEVRRQAGRLAGQPIGSAQMDGQAGGLAKKQTGSGGCRHQAQAICWVSCIGPASSLFPLVATSPFGAGFLVPPANLYSSQRLLGGGRALFSFFSHSEGRRRWAFCPHFWARLPLPGLLLLLIHAWFF